ncbi:FHA domain-containing protein [Conyzicola sp.]|uniref:FHA domain-containing protein n=1 Tax=Conyzicola sp. TaxID=1969404 RepID=UPI003988A866
MQPDLDDTVRRAPRPQQPAAPDFDDTIVGRPAVDDAAAAAVAVATASQRDTAPFTERVVAEPQAPSYGFRVGANGRTVLLDTAVYVGRAPRSPRIQSGVLPKLVKVASPQGEVSGTHLEIRQLATSIIVTDLRSTNGSTVSVPGSAPRSLRQGEAMVVTPGTLVDIGDGNVIEILPLQRQLGGHGHAH